MKELAWRRPVERDLPACLALHPAKNGSELTGASAALRAWRVMLADRHATAGCIVERFGNGAPQIVGFGFAAFVVAEFVDAELRDPRPGLNARIVETIANGRSPLCTLDRVRADNTAGTLQQIVLDSSWDASLSPDARDAVRALIALSYARNFAGYRIERLLTEIVDERDDAYVRAFPSVRIVDRFERFYALRPDGDGWNRGRALAAITIETIREDPGSLASAIIQRRTVPVFDFTQAEKDLLGAAADGLDDGAVASLLGLTRAAIKKRWAAVFEKVARARPSLCPVDSTQTRGVQKRTRILHYVASHPEELRPFESRRRFNDARFQK